MLIGVLSDTHIPTKAGWLPEEVTEKIKQADLIVHAGDVTEGEVLEYLASLAPLKAVKGNMDPPILGLPDKELFAVGNVKVGVIHGDGSRRHSTVELVQSAFPEDTDCIIFGHSHQAYQKYHGNTLFFNPGSPTDRRRSPKHSFGLLNIAGSVIEATIVYF